MGFPGHWPKGMIRLQRVIADPYAGPLCRPRDACAWSMKAAGEVHASANAAEPLGRFYGRVGSARISRAFCGESSAKVRRIFGKSPKLVFIPRDEILGRGARSSGEAGRNRGGSAGGTAAGCAGT